MGDTTTRNKKLVWWSRLRWVVFLGIFTLAGLNLRDLLDVVMPSPLVGAPLSKQLAAVGSSALMSPNRRSAYRAADFAARIAVADFYSENGRMPYPDEKLNFTGLENVKFQLDGSVVIAAPEPSDGRIVLHPHMTPFGSIEWNCTSPDLPAAPLLARDCRYESNAVAD